MKKIFVISRAKNESDIIESFCRYNLTYCDGILIQDNQSSDNTKEIIQKLINEGLPIYFTYNLNQTERAKIAMNEYGAELVVPLDADEFLYHIDGINPREVLDELNDDIEYQIPWRTYVYEKEPDIKLGFISNNFRYYRNPALEKAQGHAGTTLITKYLIKEKKAKFPAGIHWLEYPDEYKGSVKIKNPSKLVCAHFPIRSQMQVRKKAVPNWITKWASSNRPSHDTLDIFQLGVLFNDMRDSGEVALEKMKLYSIEYSVRNGISNLSEKDLEKIKRKLGDNLLIKDPLDVSFCKNKLKLRYTDFKDDNKAFLRSELKEIDKTVIFLDKESKENSNKLDEINQSLTKNGAIYYNTGNGFNSNQVYDFIFTDNDVEVSFNLPEETIGVRLDPVEGYGCIISSLEIISYDGIIGYEPINGYTDITGNIIFTNIDPQIELIGAKHKIDIKYNISVLKDYSNYQILNEYKKNIHELVTLKIEKDNLFSEAEKLIFDKEILTIKYESLLNEIENLVSEKNILLDERYGLLIERNSLLLEHNNLMNILNSRSWRLIKPLRKIGSIIRKNKLLYLFVKIIKNIKRGKNV